METQTGQTKKSVLITGISSGIGHGLAEKYLSLGCTVYGISRRSAESFLDKKGFKYVTLDLADHGSIPDGLDRLLPAECKLDIVILNAGMTGKFGDLRETPLERIKHVMDVNTWANKVILDHLFSRSTPLSQVVAISTGASISGSRGWNAYSLSKAALNMLMRLYARESPRTHFCALAPGLVDTPMLRSVLSLPSDGNHPTIDRLKSKRGTAEIQSTGETAEKLVKIIDLLPKIVESGSYADSREIG